MRAFIPLQCIMLFNRSLHSTVPFLRCDSNFRRPNTTFRTDLCIANIKTLHETRRYYKTLHCVCGVCEWMYSSVQVSSLLFLRPMSSVRIETLSAWHAKNVNTHLISRILTFKWSCECATSVRRLPYKAHLNAINAWYCNKKKRMIIFWYWNSFFDLSHEFMIASRSITNNFFFILASFQKY